MYLFFVNLYVWDRSNRPETCAKRRVSMCRFGWYQGFVCTTLARRIMAVLLQHENHGPNIVYVFRKLNTQNKESLSCIYKKR